VIDKPAGMTSHDVVQRVRRRFKIKKVGHTGTLDPDATGVLTLLLGGATKLSQFLTEADKVYEGTMMLGVTTDTQDASGREVERRDVPVLSLEQVSAAAQNFVGEISQIPPMFSAVKVGGKPLYKMARRGEEVERKSKKINVYSLDLLEFDSPYIRFRVACSKGTYIRTLAHDLGGVIGCGARLEKLTRIQSGPFKLEESHKLDELLKLEKPDIVDRIIAPVGILADYADYEVSEDLARLIATGGQPQVMQLAEKGSDLIRGQRVRLTVKGALLAVAETLISGVDWATKPDEKVFKLLRVFSPPI
jgi:tRNA pseudouridine55 synthase